MEWGGSPETATAGRDVPSVPLGFELAPEATDERGTELVRQEKEQLLLPDKVALERSRRLSAEQQVESEKQARLALARLLDRERRKVQQQQRRLSQVKESTTILRRTDSQCSGVRGELIQRRPSSDCERVEVCEKEEEAEKEVACIHV